MTTTRVNGPTMAALLQGLLDPDGTSPWRVGLLGTQTGDELVVAGYARKRVNLTTIAPASVYDAPQAPDMPDSVTLQNAGSVQFGPFATGVDVWGYLLSHTDTGNSPVARVVQDAAFTIPSGSLVAVRAGTVSLTVGGFGGS